MPVMNGVDAARVIGKAHPQLPMLLIGVQELSPQLADAARDAGFKGAVTKSRGHEIVEAVEALLRTSCSFARNYPQAHKLFVIRFRKCARENDLAVVLFSLRSALKSNS